MLAVCLMYGTARADTRLDWRSTPYPAAYASSRLAMPPPTEPMIRLPPVADEAAEQDLRTASMARLTEDTTAAATADGTAAEATAGEAIAGSEFYTLDELRDEMKKLAWTKGDFAIVPYGILWGSAYYGTSRFAPGHFVLYIPSEQDEGEDSFVIDTRRTRLGLNIAGPQIPFFGCAKSGAQVEVDFMGFSGTVVGGAVAPNTENYPAVLLRHAFAELKTDDWRLLAGQTWDVISPLNPGMLTYAVGWAGGNIGFRRMQIRGERYFHVSETCQLTVQAAMMQDIVTDLPMYAENANWPVLEGRTAISLGADDGGSRPLTIGVSGHIGRQGWDFSDADDFRLPTWSVCGDVRYVITDRLGIQGEFFTGENLSTFFGGVFQGINPVTRRTIGSAGGWIDLWFDWTPRWHSHVGCGTDNPSNADVPAGGRTSNSFLFGNVSFDVTKKLFLGLEVSHWRTTYQDKEPGDSVIFEFVGGYGF